MCQVNNGGCHPQAVCNENPCKDPYIRWLIVINFNLSLFVLAISWTYVWCTCPKGYIGHGYGIGGCMSSSSDTIVTEVPSIGCDPNPCVNGKCMDTIRGHVCDCLEGFTGAFTIIYNIYFEKLI